MKCVKNGDIGTQEIFDTLRKLENNNMENNFKNKEITPCSIKDANRWIQRLNIQYDLRPKRIGYLKYCKRMLRRIDKI
ncbi:TPA: hypothetical protein N2D99_002455 [Clostridium botulinum]|nr:hypothetical protein [Clostridium botulinum]